MRRARAAAVPSLSLRSAWPASTGGSPAPTRALPWGWLPGSPVAACLPPGPRRVGPAWDAGHGPPWSRPALLPPPVTAEGPVGSWPSGSSNGCTAPRKPPATGILSALWPADARPAVCCGQRHRKLEAVTGLLRGTRGPAFLQAGGAPHSRQSHVEHTWPVKPHPRLGAWSRACESQTPAHVLAGASRRRRLRGLPVAGSLATTARGRRGCRLPRDHLAPSRGPCAHLALPVPPANTQALRTQGRPLPWEGEGRGVQDGRVGSPGSTRRPTCPCAWRPALLPMASSRVLPWLLVVGRPGQGLSPASLPWVGVWRPRPAARDTCAGVGVAGKSALLPKPGGVSAQPAVRVPASRAGSVQPCAPRQEVFLRFAVHNLCNIRHSEWRQKNFC